MKERIGIGLQRIVAIAGCLLTATVGFADPPSSPRVARLTFAAGYVHIDSQGRAPGDPAVRNMPLTDGQAVVTGEDGQAEIEFEDGSVVRVTPNSSLVLARLAAEGDTFTTHLALTHGLAYFELRAAAHWQYSVDAAGDFIVPVENTTFRVNLDEPPPAIAVLTGTAHVERRQAYGLDVSEGETLRSDIAHAGRYFLTEEIAADTWDHWNEERDQAASDAAATQTLARDGFAGNQGYGWSDLDANGSWYNVPGQGQVWQPAGAETAEFDPYANGSWIWYPNSGYLWASNYAWGWTPFRCGGWSFWDGFGWGWSPNAGCGGFGFAGYGGGGFGGGYINVVLAPREYKFRRILPPVGGVHPIIRVAAIGPEPNRPRPIAPSGLRHVGGVTAVPIYSVGHSYTSRGGSAVGSALGRDFPVDQTRTPILGLQPNPNRMHTGYAIPGLPAGEATPAGQAAPAIHTLAPPPYQPLQPSTRPVGQPGIFYSARPAPSSQSVPVHIAPPVYHPPYTPPPAAPAYHPTYTPPPAPHYAAPAPAPAAHPSAPASSGKK